jgi:hexosaminidase
VPVICVLEKEIRPHSRSAQYKQADAQKANSSQYMKSRLIIICLLTSVLTGVFAHQQLIGVDAPAIIPLPEKVERLKGTFELSPATSIKTDTAGQVTAEYLAGRLRISTGFPCKIETGAARAGATSQIVLSLDPGAKAIPAEGYTLEASPDSVVIRASAPVGLFYGVQTLLQLLPPEVYASKPETGRTWKIPAVHIEDAPRFPWRGLLVDSARHFWSKDELKRVMDSMAMHKLNMLQLHLSDDQGWRVEIKKYSALTQVGAWRKDIGFGLDPKGSTAYGPDGRYGGFYTQADIRELARYGESRFITILPEIEMPGHAGAALAANPQVSCSGKPRSTSGGSMGIFCAGQDATYQFLQDVLSEVIELFPGKYIHIGGDEVVKQNWKNCPRCQERIKQEGLKNEQELQSYFVRRIEKFINSKGRTLIGWSEIREGGLAQNAVLMDWIGGAVEGAKDGHDVVMTPTTHCYLDYYQSEDHAKEPKAIGGFLPLDRVYTFEPVPAGLDPKFRGHILGAQGNLWTEFVGAFSHLEYMLYPRACALAEVGWSPPAARSYKDFSHRLETHFRRLDALGVNYRKGIPSGSGGS